MSATRLASGVRVTALLRQAEAQGGFGAVLARGDEQAGAILLVLLEKGSDPTIVERLLEPDGHYKWRIAGGAAAQNAAEQAGFLARRRKIDPDCWIVELDVASRERFTAEMNAAD